MARTVAGRETIRLRLFGLRRSAQTRIEQQVFPYSPDLTVAAVWRGLQEEAEAGSLLATAPADNVLALVNGTPIQRLAEWESVLKPGDTVTFMAKAFGG